MLNFLFLQCKQFFQCSPKPPPPTAKSTELWEHLQAVDIFRNFQRQVRPCPVPVQSRPIHLNGLQWIPSAQWFGHSRLPQCRKSKRVETQWRRRWRRGLKRRTWVRESRWREAQITAGLPPPQSLQQRPGPAQHSSNSICSSFWAFCGLKFQCIKRYFCK